jgi:hypothetical protein
LSSLLVNQTSEHFNNQEHTSAEGVRLVRDGMINCTGYMIGGLAGMLVVPFLLKGLEAELYGLWIAALTLQSSFGSLNGGLGRSVAREIAAERREGPSEEIQSFVSTAAFGYLSYGIAGAVLLVLVAWPLSSRLNLSAESPRAAPALFAFVGIGFFADQLLAFSAEVMTGLRRFHIVNAFAVAGVLTRTVGFIVILHFGGSLLALVKWHALVCIIVGAGALFVVLRCEPLYRPHGKRFQWKALRSRLTFSVDSQGAAILAALLWRSGPLLIGLGLGSASIVSYEIGQNFHYLLLH